METVEIDVKYRSYFRRVWVSFFRIFFIFFTFFLLFHYLLYGYNFYYIVAYFFVGLLMLVYCFLINIKVLYKVSFSKQEGDSVIIEYSWCNKVKTSHCRLSDFNITLRQNFLAYFSPWVLRVYTENYLLIRQKQTYFWTTDMFFKLNTLYKQFKPA